MSTQAPGTYGPEHAVNAEKADGDTRLYPALIRAAQHAREMDWPGDEKTLKAAALAVRPAGWI